MTAPEDNLPPVQPPTAGFLMQLFVVPMVIVVVIVAVCLMFNWLAHMGAKPQELVNDLNRLNPGSWQKALTIANMLADRQHAELRSNDEFALQLADVLAAQLEEGSMEPERIKLRVYLCLALRMFEIEAGLFELVQAARLERDPVEREVRLAALEAIACRADIDPQQRETMRENSELMAVLQDASRQYSDQPEQAVLDARLRERAAFVYGVLGGRVAREQLARLLTDAHPTVRYNAATGLARHGDPRAIPRLEEMLATPQRNEDAIESSDELTARRTAQSEAEWTRPARQTVVRNAMRATVKLSEAQPELDLGSLRQEIERLADDPAFAVDARLTLKKLR